jgi:two-component system OmpR family response regulator
LREALDFDGYEVQTVTCGGDAVALARDTPPDVCIVDLMLRDMSGFEAAAAMVEAGVAAPIIALSASPTLLSIAADTDLFRSTLAKPFELDELTTHVLSCLPEEQPTP